ncbi:hypothetical protein [Clostridium estertheticum]|uniref:Uncharacterized protein n=2 Tax=Clostridium estertheticum TaxID=238834 RepID=A0AA47EG78_9CLOT|nr:hypothetical protein [Clostridium estertheticum]MBU3156359.1 hypothetical protein [Clostridium estertheticum]WAG59624.1 hypothetical protein LL038_18620 [Clostridium estertheticum]
MFEELNRELINVKEKLLKKRKLKNSVNLTSEELQKETDRKVQLKKILKDEDNDVKRLESKGITSLFYSILGSKHEQLEKEKREMLSAMLKYDDCCKSVLELERELALYKASLKELVGVEGEYETVLKHKEELIMQLNDDKSQKLLQLIDNLSDLKTQNKELKEAIEAGDAVQIELGRVIDSLESAKGWGTWDILGGGLLATAAKHSHIDQAKEYAHSVKGALVRFQNELSDVRLTMNIDINIGSFETFADYFFDGLISDWVVQSGIHESLDGVQSVRANVENVMDSLKEKFNSTQNDLLITEKNLKSLVEQA